MKVNNIIKFIIIGLIILIFLFVVFSFTSIVEGLNNIDCSKCEVKPNMGNCIQIKDLSYADFGDNIQAIDFNLYFFNK